MEKRTCHSCRRELASENPGKLCSICTEKVGDLIKNLPETLNVSDMSKILHVAEETVRRQRLAGKLPPCIPNQRKRLWLKSTVMAYFAGESPSEQEALRTKALSMAVQRGFNIAEATSYGNEPDKLVDLFKSLGQL